MAILKGDRNNNKLNGTTGNDSLYGFDGNDTLNGGRGNDILDGGLGIDSLSGGTGNDTYIVDNIGDIVKESANAGTDTVKASVSFTLATNVENLILTGIAALDGTGNSAKNTLTGNTAANKLVGNAGDDTLDGNTGVDSLYGGTGNDLIKIKEFNDDVIDGGIGRKDVLQISGANQNIDLTDQATLITGIEQLKFSGAGNNVLTLNAQSVLDMSTDGNTLTMIGDVGDTLIFTDVGWSDPVLQAGYNVYKLQGATVKVNIAIVDITIPEPNTYTISDAATAAEIGSFFTDGADTIVIDLGGIRYNQSDLSGGEIDLTGFGLEDTLVVAVHDGIVADENAYYASYRSYYISQTGFLSSTTVIDRVSWQKSASNAWLVSGYIRTLGRIQIVGLPEGLPDSQFIFM